ncbi:hypothetical protein B0T22DRAFT_456099 [Podospora appendiculata]|uniref:Uncharacterized protein n=1 Tax=Podospora appendiculata TaxID=314037 RepID=A0AAE0XMR4_9PEZI|nr:hypothetical protein B0T22DRAFT_456099 [Podospora appendiculata]
MPLGITTFSPVLYDPANSPIDVDDCFVHGLEGDSIDTWTWSNGVSSCCWPRDLLPRYFPNARIMTFGYNANILRNAVDGAILEFGNTLLTDLTANWDGHPSV